MDPTDGVGHTFPADRRGKDRLAIKSAVDLPRRFLRYSRLPQRAAGEGTGPQLDPKE